MFRLLASTEDGSDWEWTEYEEQKQRIALVLQGITYMLNPEIDDEINTISGINRNFTLVWIRTTFSTRDKLGIILKDLPSLDYTNDRTIAYATLRMPPDYDINKLNNEMEVAGHLNQKALDNMMTQTYELTITDLDKDTSKPYPDQQSPYLVIATEGISSLYNAHMS